MRKTLLISMITASSVMLGACGNENSNHSGVLIFKASEKVTNTLEPTGYLNIKDLGRKGIELEITLDGLEPGVHAMHLHETGECKGPDFKSAGGHFNPTSVSHGQVENGPHAGDMMNIEINTDGTGKFVIINPNVSLHGKGGLPSLRDSDGTSLIIHAKADDYTSQPSGAAGPRIACTVIPLK